MIWNIAAALVAVVFLALWISVSVELKGVDESYRAMLRSITPAPQQIWIQDGADLLYIVKSDASGVTFSLQHPLDADYKPQVSAHTDAWPEWRARIEARNMVLLNKQWG